MFNRKDYSTRQKQDISALPFDSLATACRESGKDRNAIEAHIEAFAEGHGLKHKPWLYHQLLAHVGRWTLSRNESGKFSAREMLAKNATDLYNQGIYYFLTSKSRFVAKQSSPEGLPFCALVPLILAAHKKMSGVKYEDWDKDEVSLVIDAPLYAAASSIPPEYSVEELLQFRVIGLTTKSGSKAGTVRSAVSTYGLNGLPWVVSADDDRAGPGTLPQLLRMMLCQTWCAHPANRNHYMILDPTDWDKMPAALVDSEVMQEPATPSVMHKLPWDIE